GPVGAAAGLFVQTLIGKSINRAARSRYQVKGSWDKPQIILIGKDRIGVDEAVGGSAPGDDSGATATPGEPDATTADPVQAVLEAIPGFRAEPVQGSADPATDPRPTADPAREDSGRPLRPLP
ncbi:MAG: hypothetical protein WAU14_04720, partial [Dokdonella sp.]|uniref:hypothetical protein n=1 Tax=Dokdonella sp. TaxID=2291710 RepID=UPI003BAFF73E